MKYIFDFDDVLFNNTAQFKKQMFEVIAGADVPEDIAREYYLEVREKEFSLKDFIGTLFSRFNIAVNVNETYELIMQECLKFLNLELIKEIKKLGKENCYLVTNGGIELQEDKIKRCGIGDLFQKIYIIPETKKEIIYKICEENRNEKIVFIEDKIKFIEDLDLEKCPNLKTVLYNINKNTPVNF